MDLDAVLARAVSSGVAPAAQAAVHAADGRRWQGAAGTVTPFSDPVTSATPFDLASVTKAFTAVAVHALVDDGTWRLEDRVGRWLPDAACGDLTLAALLAHRSGLPAWRPCFDGDRAAILAASAGAESRVYSDIGFQILGFALEAAAQAPLDAVLRDRVLAPLGLQTTRFHRRSDGPPRMAPATGSHRPRPPAAGQEGLYAPDARAPRADPGEVDDDVAWALDGVAGHAGLFGPARDAVALGCAILDDLQGAARLLSVTSAQALTTIDRPDLAPPRTLGLDVRTPGASSLGTTLGTGARGAVGHLGFTGTSLWIDLDRGLVAALFTNRTWHGRADTERIRAYRPAFHDAVAAWADPTAAG